MVFPQSKDCWDNGLGTDTDRDDVFNADGLQNNFLESIYNRVTQPITTGTLPIKTGNKVETYDS